MFQDLLHVAKTKLQGNITTGGVKHIATGTLLEDTCAYFFILSQQSCLIIKCLCYNSQCSLFRGEPLFLMIYDVDTMKYG